jgi:hypothetical protein
VAKEGHLSQEKRILTRCGICDGKSLIVAISDAAVTLSLATAKHPKSHVADVSDNFL